MNQHHESISLTAGIFLIDQEIMDQLWSIWDEMFKVPTKQTELVVIHDEYSSKFIRYNI